MKIPKLLTISQKDTFVTHPVLKLIRCLLFSTIKDWEISNWSDQTKPYTESNGCWLMKSFLKCECYEIGHAELSVKSDSYQEITASDKVSLLKK